MRRIVLVLPLLLAPLLPAEAQAHRVCVANALGGSTHARFTVTLRDQANAVLTVEAGILSRGASRCITQAGASFVMVNWAVARGDRYEPFCTVSTALQQPITLRVTGSASNPRCDQGTPTPP